MGFPEKSRPGLLKDGRNPLLRRQAAGHELQHSPIMPTPFLLLVDFQSRILQGIPNAAAIVKHAGFLVDAAALFDLPMAATVQVPEKLGPLDELLTSRLPAIGDPISKNEFSATPSVRPRLQTDQPVWVAGIETHICLRQTVLGLLDANHPVRVLADATGARGNLDHELALRELTAAGATVTTAETVVYDQCRTSGHPRFRELTGLVRALASS